MTLPHPSHMSLFILPVALGLGACVADNADSGLTILKVAIAESGCTFSTDATTFLASGLIQADSAAGYLLAPVVRNDLALAQGEAATPKTVFVSGAKVTIKFYDPTLFTAAEQATMTTDGLTRFLAPLAGPVDPNGGVSVFPLEAVPVELLAKLKDKLGTVDQNHTLLDVQVTMTGTRGGSTIESNLFRYPVEVCESCIVHNLGNCVDLSPTQSFGTGGACSLLQDGRLDCCYGIDPDTLEVPCGPGDPAPVPPQVCDNGVDDPQPLICPAHAIQP